MTTDDNNVTLAFLGKQMERVQEEVGRMRDSIDVLTGIVIRLEGAVNGLTLEIAGLRGMVLRHDRDIRVLKEGA